MSDCPASPGHRHGHKHGKRPEGSRHSSDWISRLHRRHDAKHHDSREREEEAPLLVHADEHSHAHQEIEECTDSEARCSVVIPIGICLGQFAHLINKGAKIACRAAKTIGKAVRRCCKTTGQAIKNNPKGILGIIILLLLAGITALAILCPLHVIGDGKNEMCSTPACIRAVDNLLQNLHPKASAKAKDSGLDRVALQAADVDPCSDFDKFVCGGFDHHHDLRSDQGYINTGTLITAKSEILLRNAVEQPMSEIPSYEKAIMKMLKVDYTACMAEDQISHKGLKPLKDMADGIKNLVSKNDPLLPGLRSSRLQLSTAAHQGAENGLTDALTYLTEIGVPALVDFDIGADDAYPSEQAIFVLPVQAIGLSAPERYQDTKLVAEYRAVAKKTLEHFFDVNVNTSNILHLYPGQKPKVMSTLNLAQGVVDFEIKLSMITPPKEHQMDVKQSYNKINVSAFDNMLPQISLSKLVKTLAPADYTPESVIVSSPKYLQQLNFLLQMTPKDVQQAFLVWKTVQHYADRVDDPALKPLRSFNSEMKGSRIDQPAERWRHCVKAAKDDLPWIAARVLLQSAVPNMKKHAAEDITKKVGDAMSKLLKETTWMTKEDSEISAKKLQAVDQEIGYPSGLDPWSLEKYYHGLNINDDTYFDNKVAATKFGVHRSWSKLGKPTDPNDWEVNPLSTTPDYDPTLNRVIIPAALLQEPIAYDKSAPGYLLYGLFGAISGNGISKALGPVGSYYDMNGTFNDPWSDKTRKEFDSKAQCFADQYSKYTVEGPDRDTIHVNGKLTLSENMADVGGVNAAFQAWKESEMKSPSTLLPGLQQFSKEQVFWLAFGNSLCSLATKENNVERVYSDIRAPERVRILGTVANSKDFLDAFECPTRKPTCDLW